MTTIEIAIEISPSPLDKPLPIGQQRSTGDDGNRRFVDDFWSVGELQFLRGLIGLRPAALIDEYLPLRRPGGLWKHRVIAQLVARRQQTVQFIIIPLIQWHHFDSAAIPWHLMLLATAAIRVPIRVVVESHRYAY